MLTMIVVIVIFLMGFYMCSQFKSSDFKESFINKPRCPNVLIQDGSKLKLYNNKLAEVPGVNPIEFENLEDYKEFISWQQSQGINCPVLYLQNSYDAQGISNLVNRPSPFNTQGGLPTEVDLQNHPDVTKLLDAGRNDPPYNTGDYPSYDPDNQYIGKTVPLDLMTHAGENNTLSDNPMDTNWGGARYAQASVRSGKYDDDKVYKPTVKK